MMRTFARGSLVVILLAVAGAEAGAPRPAAVGAHVAVLSNAEAWNRLPETERGRDALLPAWARALAGTLPRTTAAMLELDYLHRARQHLGAKLAAKVRWSAAHANRCPYSEAVALADLRRAGADDAEVDAVRRFPERLTEQERLTLEFGRKLTLAADEVSDEEVAALRRLYGNEKLVALVQLLAYANFQDRLLLALGVKDDSPGPLAPLDVQFVKPFRGGMAPARKKPSGRPPPAPPERFTDPEWGQFSFDTLQKHVREQKARPGRIPVPAFEQVRKFLPASYPKDRRLRIKWSLVCMGYQPQLANGWSLCTRTFGEESQQDRVFEECLFWVVTRSLHCFY